MRYALPALVLLQLQVGAAPSLAGESGLHGFTLGNGLDVVVIEDHRAPVVTQTLWYRVGSAEDPAGKSGMAHFLEHLMFKATDSLAEGEFERTVEENGGSFDAFTSIDTTGFVVRIAADRLGLVMEMEADRMVNLAPEEGSVIAERDVVIEERRQVVDGNPAGALGEHLMPALYPNGPDGRPTIGSEQEIAGLTLEEAMDFYGARYAPSNAILVVAGDVRPDEVRQMAEQHFGPIPASRAVVRRERPQEPPRPAEGPIEVHDRRVPVPQLTRLYLAPQRRAGDQMQAAALVVLADLLGGERVTSIMARDLVGEDGIALAAAASYSGTGLNRQPFALYLVPRPGVDRAAAELALDALLAELIEQGPDPEEIERINGRVRGSNIYLLDDVSKRASRIGEALATGLTIEDVEAWPVLLESVTADDVRAVAIDLFRRENAVAGWLVPSDLPSPELPQ
jgi:zinc protease